jgi:hypothetical protein
LAESVMNRSNTSWSTMISRVRREVEESAGEKYLRLSLASLLRPP